MPVKCPRCKEPLRLIVETQHVFYAESVGLTDVVPGDRIDERMTFLLECENCEFSGWTNEYHEEANGIIRLFKPGEKNV